MVRDANSGEVLAERYESLGATTNNVAEYSGLIAGLETAADLAPGADVHVRMDSKLVVEQMSGRWQIKHPRCGPSRPGPARPPAGWAGSATSGCRGPRTPTPTGWPTRPWMRR